MAGKTDSKSNLESKGAQQKKIYSDPYLLGHTAELLKVHRDQLGGSHEFAATLSKPPKDLDCARLGTILQETWDEQVNLAKPEGASLMLALMRAFKWDLIQRFALIMIGRILLTFVMLLSAERLIGSLYVNYGPASPTPVHSNVTSEPVKDEILDIDVDILFLVGQLAAASCVRSIAFDLLDLKNDTHSLKCRLALTQLIQRKSFKLHRSSRVANSSSSAVSLIANEVTQIVEANRYFCTVITGPLALVFNLTWLAEAHTGWVPVFATIPVIVLVMLSEVWMLKLHTSLNKKRTEQTTRRIESTGAFLSSVKLIKIYGWESRFREKIASFRSTELDLLRKMDILTALELIIYLLGWRVFTSITLLVCIRLRTDFDLGTLFMTPLAYNFFNIEYTHHFSRSLKCLKDTMEACRTIQKFLLSEENCDQRRVETEPSSESSSLIECDSLGISICDRLDQHQSGQPIISGLSMQLNRGELLMVVGQVGAGKSSLLLALLGEARISEGSIRLNGDLRFAYAAQEAWITSDSFRDNILFGRAFESGRYEAVIEACSLQRDVELLPNGHDTLVGPKGVALSGGQRARLGLARAVYSPADVYLLDDPLSAVDARVAQHIFARCIKHLLRAKLVVLVTHQLQFLSQADLIVLLKPGHRPVVGRANEMLQREDLRACTRVASLEAARSESVNKEILVDSEDQTKSPDTAGNKPSSVYVYFARLGFSRLGISVLVLVVIACGLAYSFIDYYFRIWAHQAVDDLDGSLSVSLEVYFTHLYRSWAIYCLALSISSVLIFAYAYQMVGGISKASDRLHEILLESLFKARMSFYDQCNVGELTSRYAAAFVSVDQLVLYSALYAALFIVWLIGICTMMSLIVPSCLLILAASSLLLVPVMVKCAKKRRTLTGMSKSLLGPVFTCLSNITGDLVLMRSNPEYLSHGSDVFDINQNRYSSMSWVTTLYGNFLVQVLNILLVLYMLSLMIMLFERYAENMDAASTGSIIILLLNFIVLIKMATEFVLALENSAADIEQIRHLTTLEPETSPEQAADAQCKRVWSTGCINFKEVSLRYSQHGRWSLNKLSFTIGAGEHVGIVGRTGAGKSSIISVLFRLYSYEGSISIDGVDIGSIPLEELRASLGIIPQEPVLFCDTLRRNLDPFEQYSDQQLWRALEVVNLRGHVVENLPEGLQHLVMEGGRNFSVGQRQLVCLARAVLRNPKVLLMDEATANVDSHTDRLIQRTVRSHFAGSTVITVAHRLETVLDYDRIMVLEAGEIVEFDSAENLLARESGHLSRMVAASGLINQD